MVLIGILLALMVASTILVVAAGMLSSRLSRQEGRIETFYEEIDSTDTDTAAQSAR